MALLQARTHSCGAFGLKSDGQCSKPWGYSYQVTCGQGLVGVDAPIRPACLSAAIFSHVGAGVGKFHRNRCIVSTTKYL